MIPPPNKAIAWPWRSRGLISNKVACANGTRNAPLIPWRIRKATISGRLVAIAQSKEAMVNPITASRISLFLPIRSASHPLIGMVMAAATI